MIGIEILNNSQLEEQESALRTLELETYKRQQQPAVLSLAAFVQSEWQAAKYSKIDIEQRMLKCLRARKGEYEPDKLAAIREVGGSEAYMMLTDEKCAAAISWITDILFGTDDRPFGTRPTKIPEIAPDQLTQIKQAVIMESQTRMKSDLMMEMQAGNIRNQQQAAQWMLGKMQERAQAMAEELRAQMEQAAKDARAKVEAKIIDVIDESGWEDALIEAIDDIVTFPGGVVKGPVIRKRKKIAWKSQPQAGPGGKGGQPGGPSPGQRQLPGPSQGQPPQPGPPQGPPPGGVPGQVPPGQMTPQAGQMSPPPGQPAGQGPDPMESSGYPMLPGPPVEVIEKYELEFNRVSPFDIYPLANSKHPRDGLIERHKLKRSDLAAMIGVEGYDDDAIRMVLQEYGQSGVSWLSVGIDSTRERLEARPHEDRGAEKTIDALQYWGNVQGLMLLEYGLDPELIPDPLMDYSCEVWLIGRYVIKAEINGDPLGNIPYHISSFRKRNGSFWGAGLPEIIEDCQTSANAAVRNMINNAAIASGPQVMYDVGAFPKGENLTEMRPWKIWQVNGAALIGVGGSQRKPIEFFMPESRVTELIKMYEFFSDQADTKSGVPKYSYGSSSSGGPIDTASGFSMMMNNASRGIKHVVRNIDKGMIEPTIERTHEWQLLYSNDPEYYVGDIKLVARGSSSLTIKEQMAVRRNELLQVCMNSSILEIIGKQGLAAILRSIFAGVDFEEDDIVPSKEEMVRREKEEALMRQIQQRMLAEQQQRQTGKQSATAPEAKKGVATDAAGAVQGGRDARLV